MVVPMMQISLLAVALVTTSAAHARQNEHASFIRVQSSIESAEIGMAQTVLNEGIEYEQAGKLVLAVGRFMDLLDLQGNAIGPYQAIGAVHVCGALAKMNKISEAREYCRRAINWPGVPDRVHEAAERLLSKLPER